MTDDKRKDGGPAYPTYHHPLDDSDRKGMTLRDWFAGQALGSILTQEIAGAAEKIVWAELAYQYADAMLAQREKPSD
jgi:hypothetical protein